MSPISLAISPIGLEGMDDQLVEDMRRKGLHPENLELLPDGRWMAAGRSSAARPKKSPTRRPERMMEAMKSKPHAPSMRLYDDPDEEHRVWKMRESGLGATARVPGKPDTWEGWEDSAVPPEKLGPYLRDLRELFDKYEYDCALYGHFGQGCVHTRIDFDFKTQDGIRNSARSSRKRRIWWSATAARCPANMATASRGRNFCRRCSGMNWSHAFREFKAIWDPEGKMNPGKIVDPYRIDENLRLGADYHPPEVDDAFSFPEDERQFCAGDLALRRASVNAAREHGRHDVPELHGDREEKHSTRGRARLLFEMLQGDPLKDGWRSETVSQTRSICAWPAKAARTMPGQRRHGDVQGRVLSHYYEGRLRPTHAYAMGLIYWWARLASRMPGLANFITQTPGSARAREARWAGIALQRKMPPFAPETFTRLVPAAARAKNVGRPQVILWPDTFNNYFFPETAEAAVEVLEAAGFHVAIPAPPALLRPPALRLRHARPGKATAAADPGHARMTTSRRDPDRRAGAELRGGLSRRARSNCSPMTRTRSGSISQVLHLGRIPRLQGAHVEPPQLHRRKRSCTAIAIRRPSWD